MVGNNSKNILLRDARGDGALGSLVDERSLKSAVAKPTRRRGGGRFSLGKARAYARYKVGGERENGAELVESALIYPIFIIILFAIVNFSYAYWQVLTINYSMSQLSWDLPKDVADGHIQGKSEEEWVRQYLTENGQGLKTDPDHLTIYPPHKDTGSGSGDTAIFTLVPREQVNETTPEESDLYGYNTKRYVYSYVNINFSYAFKIDWIMPFGDVFARTIGLDYVTGDTNLTRSIGKDFYFE